MLSDAPSSRKRWEAVLSAPLSLHVATGFSFEDLGIRVTSGEGSVVLALGEALEAWSSR